MTGEVRGAGIEGRIEVDEVYAFRGHMLPEDSEVIAKVELVFPVHLRKRITHLGKRGGGGMTMVTPPGCLAATASFPPPQAGWRE